MATMAWVLTAGLYDIEIIGFVVGTEDHASEAAKVITCRRAEPGRHPSDMVFVSYEKTIMVNKRGEAV